ncbi:MAG TPA: YjgP/YjgQ family permease [Planctomycetes bacterium]|nr:YjgP/YjgQ family permease [Planctomycetota bacterium]
MEEGRQPGKDPPTAQVDLDDSFLLPASNAADQPERGFLEEGRPQGRLGGGLQEGRAGACSPGEPSNPLARRFHPFEDNRQATISEGFLRILHRYYLQELAANFLLTFGVLFAVALLVAVARWTYHSAGLDPLLVVKAMLLWSVDPLPHLIPVAVMIAVVLTYGRAAADREILAVRMGGVHIYQVLLPAVFMGVMLASLNGWLLHNVIPTVYYRKHRMVADVASQFFSKTNPVNNLISFSGFRMLWRRKKAGRFEDVWVDLRKSGICGHADEVWMEPPKSGKVRIFFKGFRGQSGGLEIDEKSQVFQADAEELDVQVDVGSLFMGRRRRVRYHDMTTAQLVAELRTGRIFNPSKARRRIHFRMCHSLAALLFALIGAPIGILFRRGGRMAAFGLSFFPILGYYALAYLGEAMAVAGGDPVLTGWLPGIALGLLALVLNIKVMRI